MEIPHIDKFKLGKKYKHKYSGEIFEVVGLCDVPSIDIEDKNGKITSFGIGGLISEDLEEIE